MMDAVEYLKERDRMCYQDGELNCRSCGLYDTTKCYSCTQYEQEYPEEAVRIVEEWSKAHPKQTNGQKFDEVFGYGPHDFSSASPETTVVELTRKWWDAPYEAPKGAEHD